MPNTKITRLSARRSVDEKRIYDLNAIAKMTDEMIELVDKGELENLSALQLSRDIALRTYFDRPPLKSDSLLVVAKISELISQNEKLVVKVMSAKQALAAEMRRVRHDARAAQSYLSVGG